MSLRDSYEEGKREAEEQFALIGCAYQALKWIMWHWVGLWFAILWIIFGIVTALTIIGIPYAKEVFVSARFTFLDSDRAINLSKVQSGFKRAPVANILWCFTFGLIMSLLYMAMGILMFCTLIFIPHGIAYFKMAKYSFMPFGTVFV